MIIISFRSKDVDHRVLLFSLLPTAIERSIFLSLSLFDSIDGRERRKIDPYDDDDDDDAISINKKAKANWIRIYFELV